MFLVKGDQSVTSELPASDSDNRGAGAGVQCPLHCVHSVVNYSTRRYRAVSRSSLQSLNPRAGEQQQTERKTSRAFSTGDGRVRPKLAEKIQSASSEQECKFRFQEEPERVKSHASSLQQRSQHCCQPRLKLRYSVLNPLFGPNPQPAPGDSGAQTFQYMT